MIGDLERGHRYYPTPGLADIVSVPAAAYQAIVEGRKAEGEGRTAEASEQFHDALRRLGTAPDAAPLARAARAAAQAGIVRLGAGDGNGDAYRQEALRLFASLAPDQMEGADLADQAALLAGDDPKRRTLLARAASTGPPPVWVACELLEESRGYDRRRLIWSTVCQAPLVPRHHVALAELYGDSDQSRSSELAVAAALHLHGGDWANARTMAERAYELDADNAGAALVLADAMRLQDEASQAMKVLDRFRLAVKPASPLDRTAIRARARALEALGRRREALAQIEPLLLDATDPYSSDFVFAGRLHTALAERDQARAAFDKALTIDPDELSVVYASVVDRLRRQQTDAAVADVEGALQHRPQDSGLVVLLGHLKAQEGTPGAPDDQISRAAVLGEGPVQAWSRLSFLRNDQGDRRGAAEALARALKEDGSRDSDLLLHYGQLLLELEDHDGAITALRHAARIDPLSVQICERLTEALLSADRPTEAIRVLDRALTTLVSEPLLLAWRGRSHHMCKNLVLAERDLTKAIDGVALDWPTGELFSVLCEQYSVPRAVAWALDHLSPARAASLAVYLFDAEDPEGALTLAETALERGIAQDAGDLSQFLLVQGLAWWNLERGGNAERSLREAVALLPNGAQLHAFLGLNLASKRRADEAESEVTKARALDPGSENVAALAVRALRITRGEERALEELDKAIFHIGESLDLLALRADLLLSINPAEALELADKLRAMGSTNATLDRTEALGLVYVERYGDAVEKLQAVLRQDPDDVHVRANLARALNSVGASREALSIVSPIASNELSEGILLLRGEIRRTLGDPGCLDDFEEALRKDSEFVEARMGLVDAAEDFGKRDLARTHLDLLLQDGSLLDEPEIVRLAWVLDEAGLALERANRSLSNDPSSVRMLTLKAGILVEREQYRLAIETGRQALSLDSTSAVARYTLSIALQMTGSLLEALAVLCEGQDGLLVGQRIAILLELGRSEEAAELVEAILRGQTKPFDDELWTTLGDALIDGGVLQPLAHLLVQRLQDSPSAAILRLAGSLLMAMGRFELAVSALEQARRGKSVNVDDDLAWAYSNVDPPRPKDVLRAVERALRRAPGDLDLLKAKADALLQIGREPSAQRLYRKVLRELSSPSLPQHSTNWIAGWCHYRLGNYDRAVDHLLRSISANTARDGGVRFDLGLVLLVSGHLARAKREYAEAVREVNAVRDPLRRIGLLQVALNDLADTMTRDIPGFDPNVTREPKRTLEREMRALARESLPAVRNFLKGIEAHTR